MQIKIHFLSLLIILSVLAGCSKESLEPSEQAIEEKEVPKIIRHFNTMEEYKQFEVKQDALLNKEISINIPTYVYVSASQFSPSSLQGVFLTAEQFPFSGNQTHLEQAQFFISGSNFYTATLHWVYIEQMIVGSVVIKENSFKVLGTVKHTPEDPNFVTAVLNYTKK